ncbi:MAG: DUF5004 domain-containing protein [Mucilaginibacter sp.]
MRYKTPLFFLLGVALIGLVINSCKKDTSGSIPTLFTQGKWQLASVLVTHTNGNITVIDTLNTTCDSTQVFTFNTDNTCTYTNFDCIPQVSKGTWSLTSDQLTLNAQVTCKDTTSAHSSKPFSNAQIVTLGQYSMVLQTGDYDIIPTATNKTNVIRYGFVRQKTSIN